jgi:hypothetical protein
MVRKEIESDQIDVLVGHQSGLKEILASHKSEDSQDGQATHGVHHTNHKDFIPLG